MLELIYIEHLEFLVTEHGWNKSHNPVPPLLAQYDGDIISLKNQN